MDPANAALLESWQLSLHAKRPKTVDRYLLDLTAFARWYDGSLLDVSKQDVERWIGEMQARGLKANTVNSRFTALRAFYRWALEEGEVEAKPTERITVRRGDDVAPDVLSPAQITALLKACEGTGFDQRRDLALIRLMLATGLRVTETIDLRLADLDLPNRIAAVRDGKGGHSRVVRLDADTAASLDRYKRVRARHKAAGAPALWLGKRGLLTAAGVSSLLDRRGHQAGVGHIHPHQLRHTWASRWLAAGGEEGDLQQLGGWQSAVVMRRYGRARAVDRALQAYDRVDPMRGL